MERKRKCFEPPRPLTLGSASNERGDEGHSDNVPAQRQSDIETAQGSLAFIARVLAQSQNASREHSSELNAEQERHAQTRRALRRANIERIDAIQQLSSATQAVHELNRELQTERARHENTKLALSDERAAHAQTEKARQQAVDTLNDTIGQPKSRRESAAGVGSMLAQERGIREQGSPRTTAVDPLPLQQVALSDATRALNTPFRRSVSSLRNQLGRHANAPQSGGNSSCLSDSPPQPFAGSPAAAAVSHSSSNCNTDDVADVSTSTGAWAAEYANDDGQGSDGDEQETTDRPMIASPRPVRNRHAPSRWQDDPMSAVDLGGSDYRLRALKKGEVDVSGSYVRRLPPKGHNNTWSQVHRPGENKEMADGGTSFHPEAEESGSETVHKPTKASASEQSVDGENEGPTKPNELSSKPKHAKGADTRDGSSLASNSPG